MHKLRPPKDEIILEMVHSYGHLWFTEPPMYDGYLEVISSVQKGPKCQSVIHHYTVELDSIDELFESDNLNVTGWRFEFDMVWSDHKNDWEFDQGEMVGDFAITFNQLMDKPTLIRSLFAQLDFYDYLDDSGLKSAELMNRLHPTFKPFYDKQHAEFEANGWYQ